MFKPCLAITAVLLFIGFTACKKSQSTSNAKTVQNLAGSYNLTALVWTQGIISVNVYDSLIPCEKDNVIQLNTDLTVNFHDAGIVCSPPLDANGHWRLSANADSLYLDTTASFIKSWDGKTLVLTGYVSGSGNAVIGTSTFVKK